MARAVFGRYRAYFRRKPRDKAEGFLDLEKKRYRFFLTKVMELPAWASKRFSFVREQEGTHVLRFETDESQLVEDLDDRVTLARICFGMTAIPKGPLGPQDRCFLIKYDRRNKRIFFHGEAGEYQVYVIEKSIPDKTPKKAVEPKPEVGKKNGSSPKAGTAEGKKGVK